MKIENFRDECLQMIDAVIDGDVDFEFVEVLEMVTDLNDDLDN
jgi:hypothetical protein